MKELKLITETSSVIELWESKSKTPYMIGIFASAETKNANGRVYDKSVLEREVERFIREKVNTKSAWGELGHPDCLCGDTEILTDNGWKRIDSISENEIVATLNTDTNEIEYHKIDEYINEPYKGEMYHIKGRQIDMLFTPRHRHLLYDKYHKPYYIRSQDINYNTRKIDKSYIPKIGNWIGNDNDTIFLNGTERNPHSSVDYTDEIEIDLSVFMSFLGIYLAEGHVDKRSNRIFITQNEGKSADVIRDLLSRFPEEMTWEEYKRNDKSILFYLSDERLWNVVSKLGNCYEKHIPNEYKQYDSCYLELLLFWFGVGDGRGFMSYEKYNKKNVFSVSEQLIDDLSEIAFKCGISTRKKKIVCDVDYKFADRIIKAENKQPLYQLELLSTNGIYLDRRFIDIDKVNFDGNVYCIKVRNQNFYIRNNNSVAFWTGNSSDINLDNIAMIIESLEWKGNDVYGKAKILDTPKGQILKTLVKEGNIGVSTRGLGTVNESGRVNDDYTLITIDAVSDASNPGSRFVNGILEGKTFTLPEKDLSIDEARERLLQYQKNLIDKIVKSI